MTLTIAAQLADDDAPGGFQAKALAAVIYQAQLVIADPTSHTVRELALAKSMCRNPTAFREICAWVIAGDTQVHATATPTDAVLIGAADRRWGALTEVWQVTPS